MNINIKATGIELTPDLSDYVHKKIGTLKKYLSKKSPDVVVQVEVGKSTEHHRTGDVYRAEVHVMGDGMDMYAVSQEADIFAAIDAVKDEITREARKTKSKESTLSRKGGAIIKNMMKGFSWSVGKVNPKNFRKK